VRGTTYTFGSSGLLFRSNKLMYDHQTNSLWSHLRGEPAHAPAGGGHELAGMARDASGHDRARHQDVSLAKTPSGGESD